MLVPRNGEEEILEICQSSRAVEARQISGIARECGYHSPDRVGMEGRPSTCVAAAARFGRRFG
jgi:hypothetical protein